MREQLPALILGTDEAVRAEVKALLAGLDTTPVACSEGGFDDGVRLAKESSPDVIAIVLDGDARAGLALMEELNAALPASYIFAVSHDDSDENIIKAMRAGATEFLSLPLDRTQVLKALIKVTALRRLAQPTGKPGQIWTVYAPKGGAGATTIAANLACEVQAAGGRSVCLVDLDFQSADVALFLNVNPVYTMMDIALNFRRLDSVFLQGTLSRHPSGVYLLAAPPHGTETPNIPVEQVTAVLDLLKTMYDVVIVDTARAFNDETLAAFSAATKVLVVLELTLPCLRGYRRTLEVLDGLNITAEHVEVAISKYGAKSGVPLDEAKRNLGLATTHLLPRDDDTALQAVNKGIPLSEVRPGSPLRKAIADLATTFGPATTAAPVEKKKRKGILGGLFAS